MTVFLAPDGANSTVSGSDMSPIDFSPPSSPASATLLLSDDGHYSRYENVRPQSQFSTTISNTLNSTIGRCNDGSAAKARQSFVSALEDVSIATQMCYGSAETNGMTKQKSEEMPRANSRSHSGGVVATNTLAKLKYYYDHSVVRHFAPFLLLGIYTVVGAYIFYMVEYQNEKHLQQREHTQLNQLRNDTFLRMRAVIMNRAVDETDKSAISREILAIFEKDLAKIKLPKALEWDMWGAVFYVGTVLTTIGYGNITPRTVSGQALSILYAIIGIPLVLAILNQFSKKMTKFLSAKWIQYRQKVRFEKLKELKARKLSRQRKNLYAAAADVERGAAPAAKAELDDLQEDTHHESRTIPVWVALSLCISYICLIAALFCIWETRWTYFNSFYFICISCLTIGLGDIVPDHPHVLILMFVFVIFGLSIVSMLISVIQIKMEEWLYRMMIKMREEYQRKLEKGEVEDVDGERDFLANAMQNEPWYMRNLASLCITDRQASKLDQQAETFEKVLRTTNNKNIQTNIRLPLSTIGSQTCQARPAEDDNGLHKPNAASKAPSNGGNSMEMLSAFDQFHMQSEASVLEPLHRAAASTLLRVLSNDSMSETTSLPMDLISNVMMTADANVQTMLQPLTTANGTQTAIDARQMDVIVASEVERTMRPLSVDCGMDPILPVAASVADAFTAVSLVKSHSRKIQASLHASTSDKSVGTLRNTMAEICVGTDEILASFRPLTRDATTETTIRHAEELTTNAQANTPMLTSKTTMTDEDDFLTRVNTVDVATNTIGDYNVSHIKMDDGNATDAKRRRFSNTKQLVCNSEGVPLSEQSAQCCGTQVTAEDIDFETGTSMPLFLTMPTLFLNDQTQEMHNDNIETRSDSVIVLTGEEADLMSSPSRPEKQDLVIQTDDSYLRIARRLNQYRTNRTQTLQIYSTPFSVSTESSSVSPISGPSSLFGPQPLSTASRGETSSGLNGRVYFESASDTEAQEPRQLMRGSVKKQKYHQNFLQPAADRIRQSFKRKRQNNENMDKKVEEDPRDSRWRTQDKCELRKTSQTSVEHKISESGRNSRVLDFVAKHERGIHNPGIPESQRSYVTVVDMRHESSQS